jgi:uncharacterized protein (TIGR03000 family)
MKGRNVLVAAGLLGMLAFVQQAGAQERGQDANRANTGQSAAQKDAGFNRAQTDTGVGAQERGRDEGNRGNTGQSAAQKDAGINRAQTDTGVQTDAGRTSTGQENFNRQQFDNNRGGNTYSGGEVWYTPEYGRRGWRGNRWYSGPYYRGYTYYDNGTYSGGQSGQVSGYYSPEMQTSGMANNRVLVRLFVPSPDARVWFEGEQTVQGGSDRLYISPPIEPGKSYAYTIKASWMENGKEVTKEQKLPVQANQQAMASFDPRFDGNRNRNQDTLPLPSSSTAKREDTLGRPELQEPDRNSDAGGQTQGEKAKRTSDLAVGKIVSVVGDRLMISDGDGGNQRSFQIPNGTQITQNGQNVAHDTLKPGMQVSISLKAGTKDVASRVEVTSPAPTDRK